MTAETIPDRPPVTGPTRIVAPTRRDRQPRTGGTRRKTLTKPLTEFFTTIGTVVSIANRVDGLAIIGGAERLAEALNAVAKDNPVVYRNLERMLTGSNWAGVIVASGAIVLPILANHHLLPFTIPGLMPDDTQSAMGGISDEIPDIGEPRVTSSE